MIGDLFGQTAQVFRPQKNPDGFGDQRDRWSTTPDATYPCRLQEAGKALSGNSEDTVNRDVSSGRRKLFLAAGAVLSEHDRVMVAGESYEVVTVYPVPSPRTASHHVEAILSTASGAVASRG